MRYRIDVEPFRLGEEDGKAEARKLVEEAAEAFSAWEDAEGPDGEVEALWRECMDAVQAACNLMACMGATQADVDRAAAEVHAKNAARGRYGERS